MADINGSLAMAPWGMDFASAPVETPGVIIHGTLAPGIADMSPKFFVSHSDHISNGAKGIIAPWFEAPFSPLFPPESTIHSSSSTLG